MISHLIWSPTIHRYIYFSFQTFCKKLYSYWIRSITYIWLNVKCNKLRASAYMIIESLFVRWIEREDFLVKGRLQQITAYVIVASINSSSLEPDRLHRVGGLAPPHSGQYPLLLLASHSYDRSSRGWAPSRGYWISSDQSWSLSHTHTLPINYSSKLIQINKKAFTTLVHY